MAPYLLNEAGWQALWPPLVLALCITGVLVPFLRSEDRFSAAASVFALALLGVVTGMMTGMSRDPAVGTVLPAVLSLVAGLSLYLLGIRPGNTRQISACVVALAACLLVGSFWGSELRQVGVDDEAATDEARAAASTSAEVRVHEADVELFVRRYRAKIGLPPEEGRPFAAKPGNADGADARSR